MLKKPATKTTAKPAAPSLRTFTEAFVADLVAFLSAPPGPPERVLTLADLLDAITPQVRALFRAGYTADQVREFLASKRVPATAQEVTRFLRDVRRESQPAPATPRHWDTPIPAQQDSNLAQGSGAV